MILTAFHSYTTELRFWYWNLNQSLKMHTEQAVCQQPDKGTAACRDPLGDIYILSVEGQLINNVVSFRESYSSPRW